MNNSISIASSAMLVEMSISTWTARKLDKRVSTQVDLDNGAKNLGRVMRACSTMVEKN